MFNGLPISTTNIDSGNLFPQPFPSINTNTYNRIFKYNIGDVFIDMEHGDIFEITGFNYVSGTYTGIITMKFGKTTKTSHTNLIFESNLDKLSMHVDNKQSTLMNRKKDSLINYRIYYFEEGSGNRSIQKDIQLSNIKSLAKYLNSIIKIHPKRRVIMVSILDDNGMYVEQVKLLKKEIKEQKFLTGMRERLLAYAKYECGYELATNF